MRDGEDDGGVLASTTRTTNKSHNSSKDTRSIHESLRTIDGSGGSIRNEKAWIQWEKAPIASRYSRGFRRGVLTALMCVCGAGKTTLLDVLAGRKTRTFGEIILGKIWLL
ncbi:pleiotropic drug resistance protein 1 [Artemisia annua]|uniref:Pleiotropic drug resistance protein 1 n=1 Tax=Artemisia annua TaxID=35608 RepID=A0A2U1MDS2_ARTAN|nr:pleiotropic drug resistance protein 1 [Artemisia annua]